MDIIITLKMISFYAFPQSKDLADRAEKKLPFASVNAGQLISRLEKLVYKDTYREELYKSKIADQKKKMRATGQHKGIKSIKLHDKPTFVKKLAKGDKEKDSNSVPVTEIPRARSEILPTTPTDKGKDPNPVWFSESKTKLFASKPKDNLSHKNSNHPTTTDHSEPIPPVRAQPLEKMATTVSGVPVRDNANENRIPTQTPLLQKARVWGSTVTQTSVPRSQVQNTVLSNALMAGQRQNTAALNRAQYNNFSPMQNAFQKTQIYQNPNRQLAPGYARPPNPYQWRGNQAWQSNRAGYQNSWGRGYSPPSYSSEQLDIGRRKRDVPDNNRRQRRQSSLWYNTRQYPSQYNYPVNRGIIPRIAYPQSRNYYPQNNYRSSPNQAAASTYQTSYQRSPYRQSLGMGLSPASQQRPQGVVAPSLRSETQTKPRYGTQPGILSGARPAPVERWPTMAIQKPTLPLHSQNAANSVPPSTKSRIEVNTNQNQNQNSEIKQKTKPGEFAKPTAKITNKLPPVHEVPKTTESKKTGPQNDLMKKLQDMTSPSPRAKTQINAHKHQNLTDSSIKRNEKHVVPMFGGDILLSVGVLQLLQKFARLSGSKVTETELKVRIFTTVCYDKILMYLMCYAYNK